MIPLIMAAGAAIQVGGAIAKGISGAKRSKEMRNAIANYDRQELENAYRGKVDVSRLGAELQTEEAGRFASTTMDALASGGVRGMVGGVGRVQANHNEVQRRIGADLDMQKQRINFAAANDDARIRQMREQREQADLDGMGAEMEAGRQDMWSGIGDLGQGLMSFGGMTKGMGFTPKVDSVQSAGFGDMNKGVNLGEMPKFAMPKQALTAPLGR